MAEIGGTTSTSVSIALSVTSGSTTAAESPLSLKPISITAPALGSQFVLLTGPNERAGGRERSDAELGFGSSPRQLPTPTSKSDALVMPMKRLVMDVICVSRYTASRIRKSLYVTRRILGGAWMNEVLSRVTRPGTWRANGGGV